MSIELLVQRLEIGDVALIALPDLERQVEATVVRDIDRTDTTVLVTPGEYAGARTSSKSGGIGELVTVVRGPRSSSRRGDGPARP
jgi:hypothetical protein